MTYEDALAFNHYAGIYYEYSDSEIYAQEYILHQHSKFTCPQTGKKFDYMIQVGYPFLYLMMFKLKIFYF